MVEKIFFKNYNRFSRNKYLRIQRKGRRAKKKPSSFAELNGKIAPVKGNIKQIMDKLYQTLEDKSSSGRKIDWRGKKLRNTELSWSYERLGNISKAERTKSCARTLTYKQAPDGTQTLHQALFCKVRLCPICSWRRTLKLGVQVSQVMNYAQSKGNYEFLFLTLTVKNCQGEDLSEEITKLLEGYKRLLKITQFKKSIAGTFRVLEVTHNTDYSSKDFDTFHPHIHAILMVKKSYFSKTYISQARWTEMWKQAMRIDYTPIVNIKRVTEKDKASKKMRSALKEVTKYAVKDTDFLLPEDLDLTDKTVFILDNALKRRRLVAFTGELLKFQKELKLVDIEDDENLININEDELRDDVEYILVHYQWHVGYNNYYKRMEDGHMVPSPFD